MQPTHSLPHKRSNGFTQPFSFQRKQKNGRVVKTRRDMVKENTLRDEWGQDLRDRLRQRGSWMKRNKRWRGTPWWKRDKTTVLGAFTHSGRLIRSTTSPNLEMALTEPREEKEDTFVFLFKYWPRSLSMRSVRFVSFVGIQCTHANNTIVIVVVVVH